MTSTFILLIEGEPPDGTGAHAILTAVEDELADSQRAIVARLGQVRGMRLVEGEVEEGSIMTLVGSIEQVAT
jgi:hypothetical protein